MASTALTTTRRGLLGALALAPVAIAVPALAAPANGISPAMAQKLSAYLAAEDAETAFYQDFFNPITERCDAEILAVPHSNLGPIFAFYGRRSDVTTAETTLVLECRRRVRDLDSGKCRHDPIPSLIRYEQECRRFVAVADARDAKLDRIRDRHQIAKLEARSEELGEVNCRAFNALLDHPAQNAADLAAKMDAIDARGSHDSTRAWTAMLADARRLSGAA